MLNPDRNAAAPQTYVWDPFVRVFLGRGLHGHLSHRGRSPQSPCLGRLRRRRAERGADHLGLRRAGLGLDLRTDRNAAYVRDLVLFRAERHLGHSPGGGTMGVLLLVFLAATVVIGLMVYGGDQQAGPLAGMVTKANGEAMEKVHEVIANITLALVLAHVAAVVLASLHHENLVRAMITGYKRP